MIEVWQSACTEKGSILKSEMKRNKVWRLAICCSSHLHFITGQPIDSNWSQKLGFSGKEKQEKCGYWFCTVHGAWLIVCFRETHFPISTQIWNVTLSFSMLCYVFQKEFKLYQLTFGKEVERVCSKGNLHFLFTPSPHSSPSLGLDAARNMKTAPPDQTKKVKNVMILRVPCISLSIFKDRG